jgi:Flp pilus assembly pilin Flp
VKAIAAVEHSAGQEGAPRRQTAPAPPRGKVNGMLKRVGRTLRALHRDEGGADMVEYILVIAAIALPLLAIILIFRDRIWDWVQEQWQNIRGSAERH